MENVSEKIFCKNCLKFTRGESKCKIPLTTVYSMVTNQPDKIKSSGQASYIIQFLNSNSHLVDVLQVVGRTSYDKEFEADIFLLNRQNKCPFYVKKTLWHNIIEIATPILVAAFFLGIMFAAFAAVIEFVKQSQM